MNIHWKDWCWSWNSNTLVTWYEVLTHWKDPDGRKDHWTFQDSLERLKVGREVGDRGWDAWMALLALWRWVWAYSGSWCWTGKPGMLKSTGSQKDKTEWLNRIEHNLIYKLNLLLLLYFNKLIFCCCVVLLRALSYLIFFFWICHTFPTFWT